MTTTGRMEIDIGVHESNPGALDNIEKRIEGIGPRLQGMAAGFQKNFAAWTAGALAAQQAVQFGASAAKAFADQEEALESLDAMMRQYGTTGKQMVSGLKAALGGMVSVTDAARIANAGLSRSLDPQQMLDMAEAAQTLSNVAGTSAVAAFEDLSNAIATGTSKSLEKLVGNIDLADSRFARQAATMSDAEKASARLEIVLERVAKIQTQLGDGAASTADKIDAMNAKWADAQAVMGGFLVKALLPVIEGYTVALPAAFEAAFPFLGRWERQSERALSRTRNELNWVNRFLLETSGAAGKAGPAVESLDKQIQRAINNTKIITESWSGAMRKLEDDLGKATAAVERRQRALEDWTEKAKGSLAERASGRAGIETAGLTDADREARDEQARQKLITDALNAEGEARIDILNRIAGEFEQSKARELAAGRAAIEEQRRLGEEVSSLDAGLQAKTDMYILEHARLLDWIAEETNRLTAAKEESRARAEADARDIEDKILGLTQQIGAVNADVEALQKRLADPKDLKVNAEQAKGEIDRTLDGVLRLDEQIKRERTIVVNVVTRYSTEGKNTTLGAVDPAQIGAELRRLQRKGALE